MDYPTIFSTDGFTGFSTVHFFGVTMRMAVEEEGATVRVREVEVPQKQAGCSSSPPAPTYDMMISLLWQQGFFYLELLQG